MSVDFQIDTLSVAEKVQLLETVWTSLCSHSGDVRSPEWHREVLEARKQRLEDGCCKWDDDCRNFVRR